MVNINQVNELAQSVGGHAQVKQKSGESADTFGSVLSSALEKTEAAEEDTQTIGLEEINSPGFELEPFASVVTGKTDKLLGMLETYAGQLENPDVSLRNIEPVLKDINTEAEALLEDTRFLGEEDSGLKDIATQTVVTARTEYFKFQRGDYLT